MNLSLFKKISLVLIAGLFCLLFISPKTSPVHADNVTCVTKLEALDPYGHYIPRANFQIYHQVRDANGVLKPGNSVASGQADSNLGYAQITYGGDGAAIESYAIKINVINNDAASFWYFNEDLKCNQDSIVTKRLGGINFIFRDGDGTLRPNVNFSLYGQTYNADNNPIKNSDVNLGSFSTGDAGSLILYLPQNSVRSLNKNTPDYYAIETNNKGGNKVSKYNIRVLDGQLSTSEYNFSDLKVNLKTAAGVYFSSGTNVDVYKQNEAGDKFGDSVGSFKINDSGFGLFEYPAGVYVLETNDIFGQLDTYNNIKIEAGARTEKTLVSNTTRVYINAPGGNSAPTDTSFNVYSLVYRGGYYYQDKQISSSRILAAGFTDLNLKPGNYLISYSYNPIGGGATITYGRAFKAVHNSLQKVIVNSVANYEIKDGARLTFGTPSAVTSPVATKPVDNSKISTSPVTPVASTEKAVKASASTKRYGGYFLSTEDSSDVLWYVSSKTNRRYRIDDATSAAQLIARFVSNISDNNAKKIPIDIILTTADKDSDRDLLPDNYELALKTDVNNPDTDDDGIIDGFEIKHDYSPLGKGKLPIDKKYAITLNGQFIKAGTYTWYVNPADNRRSLLIDGAAAYEVFKTLSLKVKSTEIIKISAGQN